ncbi:MAG: excisionase family DNA-binding protein [Demequina sp.]
MSHARPVDRTVEPSDADALASVSAILHGEHMPALVGPNAEHINLPKDVYEVLRDIVDAMQHGKAVTVMPQDRVMTTKAAADFLGVSRPTLVGLLEAGHIPFERPSRHRRVKLSDLIAYRDNLREDRREALNKLTSETTAGPTTNEFISTR